MVLVVWSFVGGWRFFFFFGLFVWMDEWINAIVGVRDIHIYFYIYICM